MTLNDPAFLLCLAEPAFLRLRLFFGFQQRHGFKLLIICYALLPFTQARRFTSFGMNVDCKPLFYSEGQTSQSFVSVLITSLGTKGQEINY